ncbi:hypothetical protein ASD44_11500 [Mesorhizobium sp. Root554]|uniref:hypothetical protein n=1 Tax=unclassified Mesorhizobium TaxID=325217 RepID=UPI0006FD1837|nr:MULTISPECIES: hypothetical protein [unclassified Mesorhizobium]KQZ15963.1 hypothetical protein ASD27_11510 [Mesorhizobium sp. Root1471]KQZ38478.1 hypothetical protein ASD44_11500 [Mesorhizobium sp. Root554]
MRFSPLLTPLVAIACLALMSVAEASAGLYVVCDNGLRCIMAPCPSSSALDIATGRIVKGVSADTSGLPRKDRTPELSDALYSGRLVLRGSITNRVQTFNGKLHTLPVLVATAVERKAKASERRHCSSH